MTHLPFSSYLSHYCVSNEYDTQTWDTLGKLTRSQACHFDRFTMNLLDPSFTLTLLTSQFKARNTRRVFRNRCPGMLRLIDDFLTYPSDKCSAQKWRLLCLCVALREHALNPYHIKHSITDYAAIMAIRGAWLNKTKCTGQQRLPTTDMNKTQCTDKYPHTFMYNAAITLALNSKKRDELTFMHLWGALMREGMSLSSVLI